MRTELYYQVIVDDDITDVANSPPPSPDCSEVSPLSGPLEGMERNGSIS